MKENDKYGTNPSGIVNIDFFLEKVMQKYRHVITKAKEYIKHAFYASVFIILLKVIGPRWRWPMQFIGIPVAL